MIVCCRRPQQGWNIDKCVLVEQVECTFIHQIESILSNIVKLLKQSRHNWRVDWYIHVVSGSLSSNIHIFQFYGSVQHFAIVFFSFSIPLQIHVGGSRILYVGQQRVFLYTVAIIWKCVSLPRSKRRNLPLTNSILPSMFSILPLPERYLHSIILSTL